MSHYQIRDYYRLLKVLVQLASAVWCILTHSSVYWQSCLLVFIIIYPTCWHSYVIESDNSATTELHLFISVLLVSIIASKTIDSNTAIIDE